MSSYIRFLQNNDVKLSIRKPQNGLTGLRTHDQVHFGRIPNITGPIPPQSLIILVPGMYSPAYSMQALADYFSARGHQTHILCSPFNIRGGSALESTDWLTHGIDRIRLNEASTRYITLVDKMAATKLSSAKQVSLLQQQLGLQDSQLGNATAKAALGLMFKATADYQEETDLTRIIRRLRENRQAQGGTLPVETARKQLYSLTTIARKQLKRELLPIFMSQPGERSEQSEALDKTIDHVLDQIAPRVVLVGHSMGGFVSMLTLFEQMDDTAMVVGLSAPGENGTEAIPTGMSLLRKLPTILQQKGREIIGKFAPALVHMLAGSMVTDKLKANHQPFNTTLMAIGMPEHYDGLVSENNLHLNDSLPGRINILVTPQKANISEMVSGNLRQVNRLLRLNPFYAWTEDYVHQSSDLLRGIAYHCGLVQTPAKYWEQEGDILRGIFEAPKNQQGKYDYQQGKPDYFESIQQIRRLIHPTNYENAHTHTLDVLVDQLQDASKENLPNTYPTLLAEYAPLRADLEKIAQEQQPIQNGVPQKAQLLLNLLNKAF